jgi:hypothetical protein
VFLIPISFLWLWGASFLLTFFYNALISPQPVSAAVGGPVVLPGWPGAENGPGFAPGEPGSPGHPFGVKPIGVEPDGPPVGNGSGSGSGSL